MSVLYTCAITRVFICICIVYNSSTNVLSKVGSNFGRSMKLKALKAWEKYNLNLPNYT